MLADDIAFSHTVPNVTALNETTRSLHLQRTMCVGNREYDAATSLRTEEAAVRKRHGEELKQREMKRQELERQRFMAAAQLTVQKHEDDWRSKMSEQEVRWQEKRDSLDRRHRKQMDKLKQTIDRKEAMKHDIHSKYVRDMLLTEKKLAEGGLYDESKQTRRKIHDLEQDEIKSFARLREERKSAQVGRLAAKQEEERQYLESAIDAERVIFVRRLKESASQVQQRMHNLAYDMRHAHTVEFQTAPAVRLTTTQEVQSKRKEAERRAAGAPHGVPPGNAATYRGSQLLLRMQGRYPLPSLCALYDPENPDPPHFNQQAAPHGHHHPSSNPNSPHSVNNASSHRGGGDVFASNVTRSTLSAGAMGRRPLQSGR